MTEQSAEIAQWDMDPNEWPHTPPLDVWRALYEDDDNLVWRAGIGHVVNALDAAIERIEAVEALANEWATQGPSLVRNAYGSRDVHEGSTLERCADELRAALRLPPGKVGDQ